MKKKFLSVLASLLILASLAACGGSPASAPADTPADTSAPADSETKDTAAQTQQTEAFAPKGNIDFLVSSKAGGGSDIFTRSITDIASQKGIVANSFVVNNKQDGNGQIARRDVKDAKGDAADSTLLCFSTGDLSSMLSNGGLTMADFRPIAVMAADKHLVFTNAKSSKYASFEEVVEAAKSGEQIIVGGTSSDERNVYDMLVQSLGLEENFSYIVFGSSSETMTALLGGHVDVGLSKPAASKEYVLSGDINPILALSSERFSAPFDAAPTAEELGYGVIELPVWRGVIGSVNMSDEAVNYWNDVCRQVTETDEWKTDYLEKNLLVNNFMTVEDSTATMLAAEQSILNAAS